MNSRMHSLLLPLFSFQAAMAKNKTVTVSVTSKNCDSTLILSSGLSVPNLTTAFATKRSFESGGEGVRKNNLIRWDLLGGALSEAKTNLLNMPANLLLINPSDILTGIKKFFLENAEIHNISLLRIAKRFIAGKVGLLAILQSAINSNFNFSQNPGY
jgi:hypothetical protein